MKFKDFLLLEGKDRHAVLAFGRLQPPTTGHEVLVNKVKEVAKAHDAEHHIVLSHSQDAKSNPLTSQQKVKHAKRFFPGTNITSSDKEHPNFLTQAARLHKSGVTHLHMVAGSDRVPEYKKILKKYNGSHEGALFNFKKIEVHSAGERDPDAEGTTGMSGSKMRVHAQAGKFKEFKKGVPGHVSPAHTKELYHDLRKGMGIKEDINVEFQEVLSEGVHDQGIFKAVFLAGGPGSGKDYVLSNTLEGQGLIEINSDKALEFLMDKKGLDKTMPATEKDKRDIVRDKAKSITELKQKLALIGRNGLIINGTGDDYEKIERIKGRLDDLGYESAMILVNTDDEISKQRNIERGTRGGRTVPEKVRKEKWDNVQNSRPEFAKLFGDKYKEFDNSEDLRTAPPEVVKAKKEELMQLYNNIQEFVSTPPASETSQEWTATQLHAIDTLPVSKGGTDKTPEPGSKAGEQAKRLGLQYYGFGRYGQNGEVTYRSIHDTLVKVIKQSTEQPMKKNINEEFDDFLNEDLRKWFDPKAPEGGWKRINSKGEAIGPCAREPGEAKPKCMSNEKRASLTKKERASAVASKRKHDPNPERKGSPINVSNFGKGKISEACWDRYIQKGMKKKGNRMVPNCVPEETEIQEANAAAIAAATAISKKKSGNYDEKGFRKTPYKNPDAPNRKTNDERKQEMKEENLLEKNVPTSPEKWAQAKSQAKAKFDVYPSAYANGWAAKKYKEMGGGWKSVSEEIVLEKKENFLSDKQGNKKVFMLRSKAASEAHKHNGVVHKHKSGYVIKIKESIDMGIEPGLSMAGAGESSARDMGEKLKKKTGMASSVAETIGDGGEMANSVSDQKEDELKKKGISLQSFKAKRFVG